MANYLGPIGLQYLWNKIKGYANITVQSGVTSINIGGNSVAIPESGSDVDVNYDTTNDKLTKTIDGTTTDIVTAATIVSDGGALLSSAKGAANGVCPLDANQKVPAANLPSYVDDVIEAYPRAGQTALSSTWLATGSASGTVITPETGKIYVLMTATTDYTANSEFRWGGSAYVKINDGGSSEMSTDEMDTITNNWA